jgi:hypothetical protein
VVKWVSSVVIWFHCGYNGFVQCYTGFLGYDTGFLGGYIGFLNLQSSELRQTSVAVCSRQCAADCRIVVQFPTHK